MSGNDNLLKIACEEGNLVTVQQLLACTDFNPNYQGDDGKTALHVAVENFNREEIIKEILKHPKTDPNILNDRGYNALHEAVDSDYVDYVKIILQSAKINVNLGTKEKKQTALHLTESRDILRKLLKIPEIDPNLQDYQGDTPLHLYSYRKNEDGYHFGQDLIPILLERDDIDTYIKNKKRKTPYDTAVLAEKNEDGEWEKLDFKENIEEYRYKHEIFV
jgi:ankyrin repeat protein